MAYLGFDKVFENSLMSDFFREVYIKYERGFVMNNIVKNLMIFSAGVGIGSLVTGYMFKKKCEDIIEEEVASLREYFSNKRSIMTEEVKDDIEDDELEEEDTDEPIEKKGVRDKVIYSNISRHYRPHGVDYEVDPAELQGPQEDVDSEPYVISIEEFSEECRHFEKVTLNFYEDDQVLADEGEEIIDNVEQVVGMKALDSFGDRSDDPEVVYVRNEKFATDYEIIRLSKSYAETVLGADHKD